MSAQLSIVRVAPNPDSPAARASRLYAEAQAAALEQVRVLGTSLEQVIALAAEIAEGGEVYPAGVRDLCRRLSEDLSSRAQTLDVLAQRALDRTH